MTVPAVDWSDMVDRHLGEEASVTIPLRTAVDLWFLAGDESWYPRLVHDADGFESKLHEACVAAGFDSPIDALMRCGPNVLTSADGRRMQYVRSE